MKPQQQNPRNHNSINSILLYSIILDMQKCLLDYRTLTFLIHILSPYLECSLYPCSTTSLSSYPPKMFCLMSYVLEHLVYSTVTCFAHLLKLSCLSSTQLFEDGVSLAYQLLTIILYQPCLIFFSGWSSSQGCCEHKLKGTREFQWGHVNIK